MLKRFLDLLLSFLLILVFAPIIIILSFLIYFQDFHSPFYISLRVGQNFKSFKFLKFRSMVNNADKSGIFSTSSDDNRITKLGQFLRKYKIDEIVQLINILKNDMSFVGPRPNVEKDVKLYSEIEKKLLTIKPGLTDISSIVFSDEGEILSGSQDPDFEYNRKIRPWKSKLGLFYIEKKSFVLDIIILFLTFFNLINRKLTLKILNKILSYLRADVDLCNVVLREQELNPSPAPGFLKPYGDQ